MLNFLAHPFLAHIVIFFSHVLTEIGICSFFLFIAHVFFVFSCVLTEIRICRVVCLCLDISAPSDIVYVIDVSKVMTLDAILKIQLFLKSTVTDHNKNSNVRVSIMVYGDNKEQVILPLDESLTDTTVRTLIDGIKRFGGIGNLGNALIYVKNNVLRYRSDGVDPFKSIVVLTSGVGNLKFSFEDSLNSLRQSGNLTYTFVLFGDGYSAKKQLQTLIKNGDSIIDVDNTNSLPSVYDQIHAAIKRSVGMDIYHISLIVSQ